MSRSLHCEGPLAKNVWTLDKTFVHVILKTYYIISFVLGEGKLEFKAPNIRCLTKVNKLHWPTE